MMINTPREGMTPRYMINKAHWNREQKRSRERQSMARLMAYQVRSGASYVQTIMNRFSHAISDVGSTAGAVGDCNWQVSTFSAAARTGRKATSRGAKPSEDLT